MSQDRARLKRFSFSIPMILLGGALAAQAGARDWKPGEVVHGFYMACLGACLPRRIMRRLRMAGSLA